MALNEPHRGTVAPATALSQPDLPLQLPEDVDFKLQQLREMFPERSNRALRSALARSGGGMEAATEHLLFGDADEDEEDEGKDENGDGAWLGELVRTETIILDDDERDIPMKITNGNVKHERRARWRDNDKNNSGASSDEIIDLSKPEKEKVAVVYAEEVDIVMDNASSADSQSEADLRSSSNIADRPESPVPNVSASSHATPIPADPDPDPVTLDLVLANVHAVFPDCDPAFVTELFAKRQPKTAENQLVEMCVADVAETEGRYPRLDLSKNKRKREEEDAAKESEEVKVKDYGLCETRPELDDMYYAECKQRLLFDFPSTPDAFIRQALSLHNRLYVPTYNHLTHVHADAIAVGKGMPYTPLKTPRHDPFTAAERGRKKKGKGKAGAVGVRAAAAPTFGSVEMEMEWWWLQKKKIKDQQDKDAELAERMNEEEYETTGNLIECGCCYGDYPFDKCTSCDDGHLFCMECARRNAEEQIGMRRTELKCFDMSGCKFAFPLSEVRRFLPLKIYEGFMRIVQSEELRKAELPDLVGCPFCDYAAIVEDVNDKEFRCGNPDCMIVSCRACQNKTHVPMSCAEYAKENKLSVQHKIEEAMTEALLRECPKCKKKFYKTEGCNKMTCGCGQLMCYACRTPIKDYSHFSQLPGGGANPNAKSACPLYDDTAKRNAEDVVAAARAATEAERADNPDMDLGDVEEKVKEGIPAVTPAPAPAPAPAPVIAPVVAPTIFRRGVQAFLQQRQTVVAQQMMQQIPMARQQRQVEAEAGPAGKKQRR